VTFEKGCQSNPLVVMIRDCRDVSNSRKKAVTSFPLDLAIWIGFYSLGPPFNIKMQRAEYGSAGLDTFLSSHHEHHLEHQLEYKKKCWKKTTPVVVVKEKPIRISLEIRTVQFPEVTLGES